jgi:hypothetical protein
MTPAPDEQGPDEQARRRFALMSGVRLAGIAAFLLGIAVLAEGLAWPQGTGVVLVAAGAFGAFLAPQLLARRWSSRRRG